MFIFGGTEIIRIFFAIIRSKIIAVLLGPTGIGIASLIQTPINLITTFTASGTDRSAIRNISSASNNKESKNTTLEVINSLQFLTILLSIFGGILMFCFSKQLSYWSFDNYQYNTWFKILSLVIPCILITNSNLAILRGFQKTKHLAKFTISNSVISVVIAAIIYFMYGLDGIPIVIFLVALVQLILSFYFTQNLTQFHKGVQLLKDYRITIARDILTIGFFLSLGTILALATSYLLRIYIRENGNLAQVGLYSAGFTIIHTYFGAFFIALSNDYYPRLASLLGNRKEVFVLVNNQTSVTTLILGPALILFIGFINPIVIILYGKEFLGIREMLITGGIGIIFKACSYTLGMIFTAQGNTKIILRTEIVTNISLIIFSILLYQHFSISGLGVAFIFSNFSALIYNYIVCKKVYDIRLNREVTYELVYQLILVLIISLVMLIYPSKLNWLFSLITFGFSAIYSLKRLNNKSGFNIGMIRKKK